MCQCIIIMFIPCVHSVYAAMSFKLFVFMLNEYFLFVVCHLSFVICLLNELVAVDKRTLMHETLTHMHCMVVDMAY